MNNAMIFKVIGILLVCTGIHFGLTAILPMIVFAVGLGLIFLP